MYKKYFVFLVLAFGFLIPNIILAQNSTGSGVPSTPSPTPDIFNFEKAYKDYVFMQDLYSKAHAQYLLSRAQYFQAQTLASKTKARDDTSEMLKSRDDVVTTHLLAIRMRLFETEGVSDVVKDGLLSRLDADIAWWKTHKARLSSAGTLEDLVSDSDDAKKHYTLTEALVYETLLTIPLGRETVLRTSLNESLNITKNKISSIRVAGDHDTTKAERWIIETEQKLTRSLDKELETQGTIASVQNVKDRNDNKPDVFRSGLFKLEESLQFLKEASGFMKEVIKEIRYKK